MHIRKVGQWLGLLTLVWVLSRCGQDPSFIETFDEAGDWRTGTDTFSEGEIMGGVYDFLVKAEDTVRWTSAGLNFTDGVYEVEATQIDGPIDNGYGMLFRVDDDRSDFYLFMISGDGFAWIGRYRNGGDEEIEPLVNDWWFESSAIKQGLNETNTLRVNAEGGNMIFYINDREVGRVTDNAFNSGDIGLLVRTLGQGNVRVQFDNFSVTPLETP